MRTGPAKDKAVRFLTDLIAARKKAGDKHLPSISRLARDAGVSPVTMWKAVGGLSAAGVLHVKHGSGISIGPAPGMRGPSNSIKKLSHDVLLDIVEGRFHNDPALPTIKELCSIYHAGRDVLRAALEELVTAHHCIKHGRHFRIRRPRHPSGAHLSVLYIFGPDLGSFCQVGPGLAEAEQFLDYFEKQCALRNIRIERAVVDGMSAAAFNSSPDAIGHVIWTTPALEPFLDAVLQHAVRLGKPTIVYDRYSRNLDAFPAAANKTIRILQRDNFEAGRAVGHDLLHLGHRKVCFVAERLWPWAIQRREGLAFAFSEAGYPDAVRNILGNPDAPAPPQARQEWERANRNKWYAESIIKRLRTASIDMRFADRLRNFVAECAYGQSHYCVLHEPMRMGLKENKVTAWVAADAYIAAYAALPFLRSRGIHVPRTLSLVSLSDMFETAYAGVSSYHFDMNGAAMRMLTGLLYPSLERQFRSKGAVPAIEGLLINRGSLGRAPDGDNRAM